MEEVVMWEFLFVYFLTLQVYGELIGDHICFEEESYTVNVTEPYIRNITVRNYKWCMNIPPRCSYYTTKEINDTRRVEKNYTNIIQKCCTGFYQNNNKCLPNCKPCDNGLCDIEICLCPPGFGGANCNSRCDPGSWGSNCTEKCNCGDKACNPFNGNCRENEMKINPTLNNNTSAANSNVDESTNTYVTLDTSKDVQDVSNNLNVSQDYTYDYNSFNSSMDGATESYEIEVNDISIKTSQFRSTSTTPPSDKIYNQDLVNITDTSLFSPILIPAVIKKSANTRSEKNKNSNKDEEDDLLINKNSEFLIPVKIKFDDEIARPLIKNELSITTETDLFKDVDSKNTLLPGSNNLINTITISAATTTIIILLAIIILSIHQVKRNKRKIKENMDLKKSVGVSTVSVYTTSIFHTPLPDPPTFENPSYLTPSECQNSTNEIKCLETHMICNIDNKNPVKASSDFNLTYVYDHPPSTGSYRAASTIDPQDVEMNHVSTVIQTEPVYDEIPCRALAQNEDTSYYSQPRSFYMNTCSSTKF